MLIRRGLIAHDSGALSYPVPASEAQAIVKKPVAVYIGDLYERRRFGRPLSQDKEAAVFCTNTMKHRSRDE